jgi:glycosyltransferase involved in cell wall biosynthesis
MRILMLCYEFPPLGGGGSRVVEGLSRQLVVDGHEVDVVTMGFRGLPAHDVVDGVDVHRVPCVRLKEHHCTMLEAATYLLAAFPRIKRLAGRRRYDINHTHFILPDGYNAARVEKAAGLPYVITAHGSDVPGYNPHRVRAAHRVLAPIWRRVTRNAARLVCASRSITQLVARQAPGLETTEIPYGFEVGRYRTDVPRRKRILMVTRMLERKGVQHVLQAVNDLSLEHETHLVGDGPFLPALRKMAAGSRNRIVFHGWLDNRSDELTSLYESSEIFVLPSEAENFPVALMEAMSAGLAVVTTRGTGCEEVVGETGILVEPKNPSQVCSALHDLTANPARCEELGHAARVRIEGEFGWPTVAQRYLNFYRECRSNGSGPST